MIDLDQMERNHLSHRQLGICDHPRPDECLRCEDMEANGIVALCRVARAAQNMTGWDYVGDADPDAYAALTASLAPFLDK
jgi:hypothetical protein